MSVKLLYKYIYNYRNGLGADRDISINPKCAQFLEPNHLKSKPSECGAGDDL